MSRYRILRYPQDIEGCHDLIKCLVEELNSKPTIKGSSPSTGSSIFSYSQTPPAGCNGGSERDGGGSFINFGVGGVPSTPCQNDSP